MKRVDRKNLVLEVSVIAAVGAILFELGRSRRKLIKPAMPPRRPNPDIKRNVTLVYHVVYRNPSSHSWEVAPKISNLYGLGQLQTAVYRIIGDSEYFFPVNAFELDEDNTDNQFSAAVHATGDRRVFLLNVANNVTGKYSYTLRVQKPGSPPEMVDPGYHTGPGPSP